MSRAPIRPGPAGSAAGRPTRPSARADVLVVGAGPAGSSLAWRLASAGLDVDLLDARAFPRSKPCGDALSPGATPLLREMGVVEELERAGTAHLSGWRIRTARGAWFTGMFGAESAAPAWGFGVDRAVLDDLLLRTATASGVRFHPRRRLFGLLWRDGRVVGARARGPRGREERFHARLVVGADGLRSRVARLIGGVRRGRRHRLAVVGRFSGGTAPGPLGELRLSAEGVLGCAPIGPGRWNVTLVVPRRHAAALAPDAWPWFRSRLEAYGVWDRLRGCELAGDLQVTGPFELSPRRLRVPGAILIGDAAGYFDPFTGQGIYRALRAARLAAPRIGRALSEPAREAAELGGYVRDVARAFGPARRVQRAVDATVSRPAAMRPLAALLRRRPGLASLLVDVTGDRVPAGALAHPGVVLRALRLEGGPFGTGGWRAGNRPSAAARETAGGGKPE